MKQTLMKKLNITQKNKTDLKWNQWFAGLIDGDGCFYISKQNQPSLEITVGCEDEHMLQKAKNRVGGVLKLRAGSNSVRLRVFQKEQLKHIIQCVNGQIRLKTRQHQFQKLCSMFNIEYFKPEPLTFDNGYIAGIFDADGSVTISVARCSAEHSQIANIYGKYVRLKHSRGWHSLSVHITNKDGDVLNEIHRALAAGKLITEAAKKQKSAKRPNALHRLYFKSFEHVNVWLVYITKHPLRSSKFKRCLLLAKYFNLYQNKVHLAEADSLIHKKWDRFCKQWFKINNSEVNVDQYANIDKKS